MNTRTTTSTTRRTSLARFTAGAAAIWADCRHADARMMERRMGPVSPRRTSAR